MDKNLVSFFSSNRRRAERYSWASRLLLQISLFAASFVVPASSVLAASGEVPVEDPFAWLEGPVHCEKIKVDFRSRYGVGSSEKLSLKPVLQEELRHLVEETCENKRYESCDFSWCGRLAKAKPEQAPVRAKVQELDEAEAKILQALGNTTDEMAPVKAVAPVARKTEGDLTGRARLATPEDAVAPVAQKVEVVVETPPAAEVVKVESRPAAAEPVASKTEPSPARLAETRLAELVSERADLVDRTIQARMLEEKARGILWQPIRVPGSDRRPGSKMPDSAEATKNARGTSIGHNGRNDGTYGRSITPGIGDRADQEGRANQPFQPQFVGNAGNLPSGDDDGRQAYRRVLDRARSSRMGVSSE